MTKWARGCRHRAGPAPGRGKAGLCWELPQGTRPLRHQILAGNGNFAAGEGQESFHEASLNTRAQVRGQKWDQAVCKSPFKARSPPPDVSASPLCFTAWRSKPVVTVGRLFFFFFNGTFVSFPGAVDLISSPSNGTSASVSGLSLGEAA